MSSKFRGLRSPPPGGVGFSQKTSSALRRSERIHSGSFFISEIWFTTSRLSPLPLLNEYWASESRNPYLYSSLIPSTCVFRSVAIADLPSSGSRLERQLTG